MAIPTFTMAMPIAWWLAKMERHGETQVDPCVIMKCFCNGLHITCVPLEGRDTKLGPISGCIITLSLHHIASTLNGTANKSLNG
jgi:hypothetical protein